MSSITGSPSVLVDKVRASRAGHTFHERWAARRALQLVFPKDNLFAITIEGLSPNEPIKLGQEAEDIADLVLFYGNGDTFHTCSTQQILQFKYKVGAKPVTSSYLKKTIKKFAATLREFKSSVSDEDIQKKLSFGFVTNAEFSDDLWGAVACLKSGGTAKTNSAKKQLQYLKTWCQEEKIKGEDIFPLIEFRASTADLPAQNRSLRRTISDWSANSTGQAAKRLFALVELVREKAQIEGQGKNSIRREDVLDALECDEDQLFPADTRFVDVGNVVERTVLQEFKDKVATCNLPLLLHADGGVGKTVFIQSLAAHLASAFEVIVFDCFGGGAYRSEAQARHLPRVGLLQIINELATRGVCDPLLPTDSDQYGLIEVARKRLKQASETIRSQSSMLGVLVVLDAADNAQLEANVRNEASFPRLLLASLSAEPIDGVKLLLTARPHRMDSIIGKSQIERLVLDPFNGKETRCFLETRRASLSNVDFSTAFARSRGNARVLEYLVESWDTNISGNAPQTEISVEELIGEKCQKIFRDLDTAGWSAIEVRELFAALSLLPPPIPLTELAEALGWSNSQVNSAASDLAPMLELVKHGAIFRDEPTETYIKDHYSREDVAQQSIAKRLRARQSDSIYAAEALPHFLVVIGDTERAYELASSNEFPVVMESEYGRRRLKLARLYAAFSLATRDKSFGRVLSLSMKLSQIASANAKGDQFIRNSPALAAVLGDSDASRRLFIDRSGWRGARDARLIVVYSFSGELDEARIHQNRAIGWINWYLHNDDETQQFGRSGPEASDVAAVMFLSVLENEFSSFNPNIRLWSSKFALSVIEELIVLCTQHEVSNESEVLQTLAKFAASKGCLSLTLQIGLLSKEYGLSKNQLKAVSRAASSLSVRYKKKNSSENFNYDLEMQSALANAAMCSFVVNSKQSAKRLLKLCRPRRPSSSDYGERYGASRIWAPVQSACVAAWSSGRTLSFHDLIPKDVKAGKETKLISTEGDLRTFLDGLITISDQGRDRKPERRKRFSTREREDVVKGAACVLRLVGPIEATVLSRNALSNDDLASFLATWKAMLRPDVHWQSETGRDNVARNVGIGLAAILLRYSETIEKKEAKELIEVIDANRFSLGEKLSVLGLIARRTSLADVAGAYANSLSNEIVKDDYIEQRGTSFRDLAGALISMSIEEAQEYYSEGLAQLDQMGGNDFDLIYAALHYAAKQPGGFVESALSHRLMNLCQTIFQDEPSKFGWLLFARAAASSIGFSAIYKLLRWSDQGVADYSNGLPQLACYLAKEGHLDARRAAVLLTVCEDHGWHDWQVGKGLSDLLSIANPMDRQAIFLLVMGKLDREHSFGGWESLWDSLVNCADTFEEVNNEGLRDRLEVLREIATRRRTLENAKMNYRGADADDLLRARDKNQNQQSCEEALTAVFTKCDPTSASSLDEAIQDLEACDGLPFDKRKRLFDEIRKSCPYGKRVKFLEAVCESVELEFDSALEVMSECVEAWGGSSTHVTKSVIHLIQRLFAYKGSELFDLRYSGISREIDRLSKLCGDPKLVLQTVLETIAKERLELGGDEWLQLATSLSCHTDASTALETFEDLLSSSAAKVGDEIGEGPHRAAFMGASDEADVLADIIWHLLGDSDAFVRWNAARSLKGMLDVGLTEDVRRLIERFDRDENGSLASDEHHFAVLNAQQWLLMGLARAALHHGDKLEPLKSQIAALAKRGDLHVLNKLHLARCLTHIEGSQSMSSELVELWAEVRAPRHGIIVRDGWPEHKERKIDFGFGYDFEKHIVSNVAELFAISNSEASDCIAKEIIKRWPHSRSMSDFPGRIRYREDERFETYSEHIQRHASSHAVTTLVQTRPVTRSPYGWSELNPWQVFLKRGDVSYEDGSWLSDHKDLVPIQAHQYLIGERTANRESLVDTKELFQRIGFLEDSNSDFFPVYGRWKSPDGVNVRFVSALTEQRGAVGLSSRFAKKPDHELWLPIFGSDGRVDRFANKSPFRPLIWDPDMYPVGIDEADEWAARGAIARPQLGLALNRLLGLTPSNDKRKWYDGKGTLLLKNEIWGEWRPNPDDYRSRQQDDGAILWAKRELLDEALKSNKRSLIYKINFSKYASRSSYDDDPGIRQVFVGLKNGGKPFRFWHANAASKSTH